jgi:hypothetical protein
MVAYGHSFTDEDKKFFGNQKNYWRYVIEKEKTDARNHKLAMMRLGYLKFEDMEVHRGE